MTNKTKLEPCPFCKNTKPWVEYPTGQGCIECPQCGSYAFNDTWNTRPIEADLRDKLEKVSRLLKMTMGRNFTVENHGCNDVREAVAIAVQVLEEEK